MSIDENLKLGAAMMSCKFIALLALCLFLGSCSNPEAGSDSKQANFTFIGDWQGNGTDAEGNELAFEAKVSHSGDNKYRVLILDKLDTLEKPIHVMDGVLENNDLCRIYAG